jgi:hypothetical protein
MLVITTGNSPTANDVCANATGTLINTGKNQFLVTNHHVYAEFRSRKDKDAHGKLIRRNGQALRWLHRVLIHFLQSGCGRPAEKSGGLSRRCCDAYPRRLDGIPPARIEESRATERPLPQLT